MSAVARLRAVVGTDNSARVKKFEAAETASKERLALRRSELDVARASFEENANVAELRRAEKAVADEEATLEKVANGRAKAQRDLADEQAEQAARETEQRQTRMRKEVEALGTSITEQLVELGRLLGTHERLVESLPNKERYCFWPPTYAETVSKALTAGVDYQKTRTIEIKLTVPVGE